MQNALRLIAAVLFGTEPPSTPISAETEAVEPDQPEKDVISRRRLIPAERLGQRFRRQEVCMTREHWEAEWLRRR